MSESDIEMKIVQPLIEHLGWDRIEDVRSQYSIRAGTTSLSVDYALFNSGNVEVIIEVKSDQSLNDSSRDQLRSYLRQAESDWGLLTNGQEFQIIYRGSTPQSSDDVLINISMPDLETEWDKVEILSKENIISGESYKIKDQLDTRKQAINLLSQKEHKLKDDILNYLVGESNESLSVDLENEVNSFVESLIRDLSTNPTEDSLPRSPEEILEALGTRLPGRSEEVRYERAAYVLSLYSQLQECEKITGDELKEHLLEEYRDCLSSKEVSRQWVNYIRDNLSELPRIEPPAKGASKIWRYITPELEQSIQVDETDQWISDLENIPVGSRGSKDRQRAMIQRAYNYLTEEGRATKDEIETILPDYTAHYQDFSGFWSYCIQQALKQCEDIESPVAGHQAWRYIGEKELPAELNIEIEDWVFDLDVPGQKMTKKERESLIQYCYNFLREAGEAQRGDFKQYLRSNVPSEIGRYSRFQGLWTYLLKDSLKAAPGVQTHSSGKKNPTIYTYPS